jgi:hypothetical protein
LLYLGVTDTRYILRPSLQFTNLDLLLAGPPNRPLPPYDPAHSISRYVPPPSTFTNLEEMLSESRQRSNPRLTRAQAILVAEGLCSQHGESLADFKKPSARFDKGASLWRVEYGAKQPADRIRRHEYTIIQITINDRTGECKYEPSLELDVW